jgi:hypothetical protein
MPGKQNPFEKSAGVRERNRGGLPSDYSEIDLKLEKN